MGDVTGNDTNNNTNDDGKFDDFIQRGNQTFVQVVGANGTQVEYPLPVEEPVEMEDRVYNEETSV